MLVPSKTTRASVRPGNIINYEQILKQSDEIIRNYYDSSVGLSYLMNSHPCDLQFCMGQNSTPATSSSIPNYDRDNLIELSRYPDIEMIRSLGIPKSTSD